MSCERPLCSLQSQSRHFPTKQGELVFRHVRRCFAFSNKNGHYPGKANLSICENFLNKGVLCVRYLSSLDIRTCLISDEERNLFLSVETSVKMKILVVPAKSYSIYCDTFTNHIRPT